MTTSLTCGTIERICISSYQRIEDTGQLILQSAIPSKSFISLGFSDTRLRGISSGVGVLSEKKRNTTTCLMQLETRFRDVDGSKDCGSAPASLQEPEWHGDSDFSCAFPQNDSTTILDEVEKGTEGRVRFRREDLSVPDWSTRFLYESWLSTRFSTALQSSPPPRQKQESRLGDDYYVNVGYAIRTLREELPSMFYKPLTYDIYR